MQAHRQALHFRGQSERVQSCARTAGSDRAGLENAKARVLGRHGLSEVLVPLTGIELVTFALRMRCSTD
ncbi:hypothetical protein MASSI9I_80091 [Massilia sp. 9I]|nr:hypothetical protein MASSI9I_80091 [Massilia sp. 9I]